MSAKEVRRQEMLIFSLPCMFALMTWAVVLTPVARAAGDLTCIKHMMIPNYNLTSRRSPVGGTVNATVTIGRHGRAAKIRNRRCRPRPCFRGTGLPLK